jgi:hypothetical protein
MRPEMRVWLAVVAVVALAVLGTSLSAAFRAAPASRAGTHRPRAAGTGAPGRPASPRPPPAAATPAAAGYSFSTLDDPADPAFNRLLGINNRGHIAGYAGSGAAGQPSRGYILRPPYGRGQYQALMVPGSARTELTGLNDNGVQVGFWSAKATPGRGGSTGCYLQGGRFHSVAFPAGDPARPPVNELLGVNDHDVAVGFYADASGRDHGYRYDIATGRFSPVTVPGAASVVAAAINDEGSVAGFFTGPAGATEGFVLGPGGRLSVLRVPRASATRASGINDSGEVVGGYQAGHAGMRGFTWTPARGFATVAGPGAAVGTAVAGVNDAGDLVGYYTDRAGNTDGLYAVPGGSGSAPG